MTSHSSSTGVATSPEIFPFPTS